MHFIATYIYLIVWSLSLITLFNSWKHNFILFLILIRYDSSELTFIKIDWSAGEIETSFLQTFAYNFDVCLLVITLVVCTNLIFYRNASQLKLY